MILGTLLGLGLSLLGLVPGLHIVAWLPALMAWSGGDTALVAGGVYVGASSLLAILHATYHPVAKSQLASADAPAKLAYVGFGATAVKAHQQACLSSMVAVVMLCGVALLTSLVGADLLGGTVSLLKPVSPPLILGVLGLIVYKAGRPVRTVLIMVAGAALGFTSFQTVDSAAVMIALLGGLFTVPAALALITEPEGDPLPKDLPYPISVRPVTNWDLKGALVGMATGFLAGVGTGSLVSLLRKDGGDTVNYVRLSAAADMGNNVFALLLFASAGSTRSGVAAAMADAGGLTDGWSMLMLTVALIVGTLFGSAWLTKLAPRYKVWAMKIPVRWLGVALLTILVGTVVHEMGARGLTLLVAASALSSVAKSWRTPNQALLSTLIGPALISQLGLTVVVGRLLL
jgi:TctA family transporter